MYCVGTAVLAGILIIRTCANAQLHTCTYIHICMPFYTSTRHSFLTQSVRVHAEHRVNNVCILTVTMISMTCNYVLCVLPRLNEGITTYLERKIIGKLHGEKERHLHAIGELHVLWNRDNIA